MSTSFSFYMADHGAILSSWPVHWRPLPYMNPTACTRRIILPFQAILIVGIVLSLFVQIPYVVAAPVLEGQQGSVETIIQWVVRNGGQVDSAS